MAAQSEDFVILARAVSIRLHSVTDGRTDAFVITKTRLALRARRAVARKNLPRVLHSALPVCHRDNKNAGHGVPLPKQVLVPNNTGTN